MFNYMKTWMATEPSDYSEKQNSFIEFNTKIDNIRKEKFDDVFPEYSKLFAQTWAYQNNHQNHFP